MLKKKDITSLKSNRCNSKSLSLLSHFSVMFRILKVFRLGKVFSILLGVFTISLYAYGSIDFLHDQTNVLKMTFALTSLFFLLCAGYLMNDYCDLEYDLINKPQNIYVTKVISKKNAKRISLILFLTGLITAAGVNFYFFSIIILDMVILAFYNLYSKKLSVLKSLIVTSLIISIYPLSFALTSGGNPSLHRDSLFIFPVWLFFVVMSYELSQDILDIKGDKAKGGNTLPIVIGIKKTRDLATISALISVPIVFLPFYYGMCGKMYLIGTLIALTVFVGSLFFKEIIFSKGLLFYIRAITISSLIDIIVLKG